MIYYATTMYRNATKESCEHAHSYIAYIGDDREQAIQAGLNVRHERPSYYPEITEAIEGKPTRYWHMDFVTHKIEPGKMPL